MMKKLIALVLSLAMVFSLVACGGAETAKEDVAILYTNDVHTYIDGPLSYDVIGAIKAELATQYKNVLLVDAGDHAQGTVYGSMDFGKTIIELMNASGYDLATLGNHEFDYSMVGTMDLIKWAEFPYVSANFYKLENGERTENVLDSYKIFEIGGHKLAFVGITTPESFTKSTPAYFQNEDGEYIYGISGGENGEDLQADVQKAIDDAKKAGATTVIGLGHLGDDPASQPWTSEETIAEISGLSAFIDGHSHSTVEGKQVADKDGNNVLLTQTGEYFDRIGLMVVGADGTIKTDFIEYEEILETVKDEEGNVVVDDDGEEVTEVVGYKLVSELYSGAEWPVLEDVKSLKEGWIEKINDELGAIIGKTALTLDNYDAEGTRLVRKEETNTGDFAADALYYLFDDMDLDIDVAIMNGGGVRNKAITGDISFLTCKEIHTFGNVACLQTVTGQQVLDALEWGAQNVGTGESGGFLQVAGVTYTIDSSIPTSVQKDDKGVWTGGPTGEYRVKDVKVYNRETNQYEDLDLNAQYNMAGNSYTLRSLGDGFNMFDGAINVVDYVMVDYMVLANYIMAFENGEIGATNSPLLAAYPNMLLDYGTVNGSGRIVVK
ncbi:MAG: bifunctional metallophosphatase/5'-nucleotidase [Oscillospiraceae bacterium]|nr:bifunctional metallophosphatase/5'-nucleotidase [Oscillospiraceae bacterium]